MYCKTAFIPSLLSDNRNYYVPIRKLNEQAQGKQLLNHQLDNLKYIGNSFYKFIFKVDLTISVDSIRLAGSIFYIERNIIEIIVSVSIEPNCLTFL